MQKRNQQSRSGWGGKRKGAGAPAGNTNAVKHGERSRRAFNYRVDGFEDFPPLVALRARNLMIAERVGELFPDYPLPGSARWRELMLLDGIMWQHSRQMIRLESDLSRDKLNAAKVRLLQAKTEYRHAQARR